MNSRNCTGPVAGRTLRAALCAIAFVGGASAQSPSEPAFIVHGLCKGSNANSECTAAVTEKQLDLLADVLFPKGLRSRTQFVKTYADVLAFANAARELKIDQSPEYREAVRWIEQKTLADLLLRRIEKESNTPAEAELQTYYREHSSRFDEVQLRRLVVPKNNPAAGDSGEFQGRAERVALELRERAARGENLDQLQKECYEALGFSGAPPSTAVGIRRRSGVPSDLSEEIFSLGAGDVSRVEQEAYSFVIYKAEARWTLARERVTDEIIAAVAKEKIAKAVDSITGNVRTELNEKFFGIASVQ